MRLDESKQTTTLVQAPLRLGIGRQHEDVNTVAVRYHQQAGGCGKTQVGQPRGVALATWDRGNEVFRPDLRTGRCVQYLVARPVIMVRPERLLGAARLAPSGSPCGRSTPLRGVVELGFLSVGSSN